MPEYSRSTRVNIDFEHNFGKHLKLESGLFFAHKYANTDNQFIKEYTNRPTTTQQLVSRIDSTQSYEFETTENNATGYTVLSAELGKWELQGGIRYEDITLKPYSITSQSGATNKNHNALPTFQIHNNISNKLDIGLSYSKRVKMPNYKELNPTVIYSWLYNKSCGNPNLEPEKIHSLELNAHWQIGKNRITPSIFYKHHTDAITRYQELVTENGRDILSRTYKNIGNIDQSGFELNLSSRILDAWHFKANLLSYHQVINNIIGGQTKKINDWVNNLKFTSDITFLKTFKWQVTATYESPHNTTVGKNYEFMFINTNIRKYLFNNKASLTLRVNDIFNTMERKRDNTSSPKFTSKSYSKGISRYAALSFSYRFNTIKKHKHK